MPKRLRSSSYRMETIFNHSQPVDFQDYSFRHSTDQVYHASICIMTRIVDLLSGRWKPIILHLVRHEVNRFGMLQKSMPAISKKVLTHQLRELEDDGLIHREVVEERHPQIVIYHLTEKGRSFRQLMDEMINWGLMNLDQKEYGCQSMVQD